MRVDVMKVPTMFLPFANTNMSDNESLKCLPIAIESPDSTMAVFNLLLLELN